MRDVEAGVWVVRALDDGDVGVVVVGEVADDCGVRAAAIVGVAEVVEGVRAGRAVGVGRTVDVDVHAMGEDVLRGRREVLRTRVLRGRREGEKEGEREGGEGFQQAGGSPAVRCRAGPLMTIRLS